jgi:hypothetical protein
MLERGGDEVAGVQIVLSESISPSCWRSWKSGMSTNLNVRAPLALMVSIAWRYVERWWSSETWKNEEIELDTDHLFKGALVLSLHLSRETPDVWIEETDVETAKPTFQEGQVSISREVSSRFVCDHKLGKHRYVCCTFRHRSHSVKDV